MDLARTSFETVKKRRVTKKKLVKAPKSVSHQIKLEDTFQTQPTPIHSPNSSLHERSRTQSRDCSSERLSDTQKRDCEETLQTEVFPNPKYIMEMLNDILPRDTGRPPFGGLLPGITVTSRNRATRTSMNKTQLSWAPVSPLAVLDPNQVGVEGKKKHL